MSSLHSYIIFCVGVILFPEVKTLVPFQILSYIRTHLFLNEEVVVISDEFDSFSLHLNIQRGNCTYSETMSIAFLTIDEFLSTHEFFLRFNMIQASRRSSVAKRTNFIFVTGSDSQVLYLISKIDEELQILHSSSNNKLIWQPSIIILWSVPQVILRPNTNQFVGEKLVNSWIGKQKPKFTIDSGVLFLFIVQKGNSSRAQKHIYLSVWEVYNFKYNTIIEKLREQDFSSIEIFDEENCLNADINEKTMAYLFLERFKRRGDFKQQHITAVVPEKALTGPSDWLTVKRVGNSSIILDQGFSVKVFKDLQFVMNFKLEILIGNMDRKLTASSEPQMPLVAELNTAKADISLYQAAIIVERAKACSFLQPTYSGIYHAFFQQPPPSSIRNIVSAPFTASLWFTLFSTWIFLIGCVKSWGLVAERLKISCYNGDNQYIHEVGMWTIAATCQKSWYLFPTTYAFQLVSYFGSLMAIICHVAYSATIVSFLTVKPVPVKTLADLITHDYKFTVYEYSQGTILLLKEMIEDFNLPQNVITTDAQNEITHIINSKKAFLSYPDLFYQTAAEQNFSEIFLCSTVYKLPAQNIPYKSALYVRKGSEFREIFSEKLIFILERGLNYRYKKDYNTKREITCAQQRYKERHVNIDPVLLPDIFTAFLVILVGWIFASWILLSERLSSRKQYL